MTSEEYVNQVNRLIDLQNIYIGIFLTILSIILAAVLYFQWRLSDKKIEKIILSAKSETVSEIERILGVTSLAEFKNDTDGDIWREKEDVFVTAQAHFEYSLQEVRRSEDIEIWRISSALRVFERYMTRDFQIFNFTVSKIRSLFDELSETKEINYHDPEISLMLDILFQSEMKLSRNSVELEKLKHEINKGRERNA